MQRLDKSTIHYEINAIKSIESRVKRYSVELGFELNKFHNLNWSERAWDIILNAWLVNAVSTIYDVYQTHGPYKKKLESRCNSPNSLCMPPNTSEEFIYMSQSTELNHLIKNALMGKLCFCQYNKKHNSVSLGSILRAGYQFFFLLSNWAVRLSIYTFKPVVLIGATFKRLDALRIMVRSRLKVFVLPTKICFGISRSKVSKTADRSKFRVRNEDGFDEFFNSLIHLILPRSYVEEFSVIRKEFGFLSKNSPAIGSAIGLRIDDRYKIVAAGIVENGGHLLGFQHGGGYNIFKYGRFRLMEEDCVSKFYYWGDYFNRGLPSGYFRNLQAFKGKCNYSENWKVLFVCTGYPKFMYFQNLKDNSNCFPGHLCDQNSFYSSLSDRIKKKFVVRLYHIDYGWREAELWRRHKIPAALDRTKDFVISLLQTRIFVSDHLSTTWVQALYIGIPIIIYIDRNHYVFTDEFNHISQCLIEAGIFQTSPVEAAEFINLNYDQIERWWNDETVKEAARLLRGYTTSDCDDNFIDKWVEELVQYA